MPHVIYGLYDPSIAPLRIRYIGYTGRGVLRRVWEHIKDAKDGRLCYRSNWIRKVLAGGVDPAFRIMEVVTADNWQERERYWINRYRKQLTNSTIGGEGLVNPSEDVRERIRQKIIDHGYWQPGHTPVNKGVPTSDEGRAKIKEGMANSEKYQAARIDMKQNRRFSRKAIDAATAALRKRGRSPEFRRMVGDANRGYPKVLGYKWINNGVIEKLIPKEEPILDGFVQGRRRKQA